MAKGIATFLLIVITPLFAHHSFDKVYDQSQPISLNGVVVKVFWINPHAWISLDVQDANGAVVNWVLEGYGARFLSHTGWKKNVTLKAADQITVTGWRSRKFTNRASAREVTFADGTKLIFGPPPGAVPEDGKSIAEKLRFGTQR